MFCLRMRSERKEGGAVLVLVALSAAVMLLFVALAVEAFLTETTQNDMKSAAQLASLAGIRDLSSLNDYCVSLNSAIASVDSIVRDNKYLGAIGTSPIGTVGLLLDGCASGGTVSCVGPDPMNPLPALSCDGGTGIDIQPGTYLQIGADTDDDGDVDEFDNNPCGPPFPCFAPNSTTNNDTASALEVTIRTQPGGIRYSFAQIVGLSSPSVSASAVGIAVPRNLVFLVDGSPSAEAANYLVGNPRCDSGSECDSELPGGDVYTDPAGVDRIEGIKTHYAFTQAQVTVDCSTIADANNDFTPEGNYCGMEGNRPLTDGGFPDPYNQTVDTGAGPLDLQQVKHYQDDYSTSLTIPVTKQGATSNELFFFADFSSAGFPELHPEPMEQIWSAVKTSAQLAQLRSISGDQIAVIRFDDTVESDDGMGNEPRGYIGLTDDFQRIIESMTIDTADPDFSASRNPRTELFFPLAGRDTNIAAALLQALAELQNDPLSANKQSKVILFSDGIANCPDEGDITGGGCGSLITNWHDSMEYLMSDVLPEYIDNNVPLFMLDVRFGAHYLQLANADGSACLSWEEAVAQGAVFGDDRCFGATPAWADCAPQFYDQQTAPEIPFFAPTVYMQQFAAQTGGKYTPLLNPAPDADSDGIADSIAPWDTSAPDCTGAGDGSFIGYELNGASVDAQVQIFMNEIMGEVPIALGRDEPNS